MNYGNLVQTGAGAAAATGLAAHLAGGAWGMAAGVAVVMGFAAVAKLVAPSAKARP